MARAYFPKVVRRPQPVRTMPPAVLHADGRLMLCLPIPSRVISPNAQRGQSKWASMKKAKVVKFHRELAKLTLVSAIGFYQLPPGATFAGYSLAFFFPTRAFRDDDNADASCKAYRDGIADALKMDDRRLRKLALSTHAKDAAAPRVEITLHPLTLS